MRWLTRNKDKIWTFFALCWGGVCLLKFGLLKGILYFGLGFLIVPMLGLLIGAIFPGLLMVCVLFPFILWLLPLMAIFAHGGWLGVSSYIAYPLALYILLARKRERLNQDKEITEAEIQDTIEGLKRYRAYFNPLGAKHLETGRAISRANSEIGEEETESRADEDQRNQAIQSIRCKRAGSLFSGLWDNKESKIKFWLLLYLPTICAFFFLSDDVFPFLLVLLKSFINIMLPIWSSNT